MRLGRGKLCGKSWKPRHRSRLLAMAHLKQAAVGFRVHSGWAAAVVVSLEKSEPVVLARQRVQLVDTFTYEFRQPFHTAEKMLIGQAREFLARMQGEARRLAYGAIKELASRAEEQGVKLTRCALLLASGRALPELEKILGSHALIHTADGEHFREAVLHAGAQCGLRDFRIKEKELLEHSEEVLRLKSAALMRRITELGKPLGPPWSQDEKFAKLAAWLAAIVPENKMHKNGGKR